jgi:hypothetical protein
MTERKRKVLSATVPEWLLKEVTARYGNVSEFTERALTNQLRMESQAHALYVAMGDGDADAGRRQLEEFEASPEYPALKKAWDKKWAAAEKELRRLHQKR